MLRSGGSLLLSTPDHGRLRCSAGACAARVRGPLRSARRPPALLHASRTLTELLEDFGFHDVDSAARRRAARRAAGAAGERTAVTLLTPARRAYDGIDALPASAPGHVFDARRRCRRLAQRLDVGVLDREQFWVVLDHRQRRDRLGVQVDGGAQLVQRGRGIVAQKSYSPSASQVCGLDGCRCTACMSVARASALSPACC